MQLIGLALLAFVVSYGFADRHDTTISAFDLHAFVMVIGGSAAAVMVSSSALTSLRTFLCLREILPGLGTLAPSTRALEAERVKLAELWLDGSGTEGRPKPVWIGIWVDDVDAMYAQVRAAGVEVDAPVDRDFGVHMLTVEDPEGYQWGFMRRIG